MKRLIGLLTVAIMIFLFSSCSSEKSQTIQAPDVTGDFNVSVLKDGQADAIILTTQNHCAVIDCGEKDDGDEVVKNLTAQGINHIDYLFITHFDKDHVGGVPEVLENVSVGKIITPDYEGTNDEYFAYTEKINEMSIIPMKLTYNISFTLDDVLFEVFPPQKTDYAESDNDFSLAIYVTHGENKFLFTGDAEADRISEIIQQCGGEYDFLKVPHHGKYNKNTSKLIDAIKPKYAVICDSGKNPAEEKVLNVLENIGCNIYHTTDGDIDILSNGKIIDIKQ